jgi:hypothetical protein
MKLDVTRYLVEKLASKLNNPSIKDVPWTSMKEGDIINWPSDVEFKRVYLMNTEEVKKLHTQVRRNQLDFSPDFISGFKIPKNTEQLKLEVMKYLRVKLASKLNKPSIKIPWSQMKAGDIINWPPTVNFTSVIQISANDIKKIHKLVKEDQLDFSPEFLRRIQATPSNANRKILKSIVAQSLKDKLASQLNNRSIKDLPWSQIKAGDIINWPADVEIMSVWLMYPDEVKRVHQLLIEDQLHFSPEFLNKYKMISNS